MSWKAASFSRRAIFSRLRMVGRISTSSSFMYTQHLSRRWQAAHTGRTPSQPILFWRHSLQATETRFLLELGLDGGGERGRVAGRRGRKLLFIANY
jgi:hypothetical protein